RSRRYCWRDTVERVEVDAAAAAVAVRRDGVINSLRHDGNDQDRDCHHAERDQDVFAQRPDLTAWSKAEVFTHPAFPFWNQAGASINLAALAVLTEAILKARTGVIVGSVG